MPEMLRECPTLVGGVDDDAYVAQIWAREMSDGRWEAWIGSRVVLTATRRSPPARRSSTGRPAWRRFICKARSCAHVPCAARPP